MAMIDVKGQYNEIKKSAIEAVESIFPIKKDIHSIDVEKVWVEDNAKGEEYVQQAKAKNKGGSWGASVYASIVLKSIKTGKVIDREPKIKLFLLPKLTSRASYIVGGNEYQVSNQLRLRPGAYVKRTKTGDVKTQFNLAKGGAAELQIDSKGIIRMKVKQARIPLYPILLGLGISEAQIRKEWGDKVVLQNSEVKDSPQVAVKRLAKALAHTTTPSFDTAKEAVTNFINNKTSLLPEMTKLTLGKEFDRFSPLLWLSASSKLIKVEKGDTEPDDVDNLAFKEFFGVEDAIKERIQGNTNSLVYKIKRGLDTKDKIKQIINLSTFGGMVEKFFTEDERASTPEQINPLHMYSNHEKISFIGKGSIEDTRLASDEMRNVHPTHLSYVDPVHTPESDRIGLNLALTLGAKKVGKELVAGFYNVKTGKLNELKPLAVYNATVAYPDQWDAGTKQFKSNKIKCQQKGKLVVVPPSQVDYVMPYAQNAFSLSTNMIPFMANDNGNRTMMAGKHMEQAIPLKYREAPLVQNKLPHAIGVTKGTDTTFEDTVGESYSLFATEDGTKNAKPITGKVKSLTKDYITITSGGKDFKFSLYNNFALNQKTFLNHEAKVAVGDKVQGGQLIADTNYTKNGVLALGKNLKVAYVPYKGYNFEDGIVITDTAAKKLTSEHIHKKQLGISEAVIFGLGKFVANFPNAMSQENRNKMDDTGIIKKGSKVVFGDTLIAAMKDQGGPKGAEMIKRRLHKSLVKNFKDISEKWKMEVTGTVTDVQRTGDQVTVFVKTEEPAKIGDKLAGRHGNKGIITKIISDDHAPMNEKGEPVEILLNPHGVISRINIGQMYESAMGKVAKKKGKAYKVENFAGKNYLEDVKSELKKANLEDTEELTDPLTGKSLGKVHVGDPYILKLNKQSDVNFSVRGENGPVTSTTRQPTKGGEEGSKSLDMLTMYSLLSHGSRANLKEMATLKSENNPEYWEALKYGGHLPAPKVPFAFERFSSMLKGAGVDMKKDGSKIKLMPLTDAQTKKLSAMEIVKPAFTVAKGKKLVEEAGGFLDPVKLGGMDGDKYAHIELKEAMPNPLFEDAIRALTDLSKEEYAGLLSGKIEMAVQGKNMTGPKALMKMLKVIDIDKEIKEIEPQLKSLKGTKLNKAVKKYRYLMALKEQDMTASEAYMRKLVPVIPAKYRPISVMESGDLSADDSNMLYRNVALMSQQLKLPVMDLLGDEDKIDMKSELYDQMKGLAGLTDIKIAGRDKAGFITQIKGKNQPKGGFFQAKVLKKNQNLVGRGTIIPEPQLHMDEAALPEKMAWKLYNPFVVKELVRSGLSARRAKEEIEKQTPLARRLLDQVMKQRPIMLNRAPSLHKFAMMAFTPKITEGKAIKIPPLVVDGFNADFDGDTMTAHVPVGDKAVREAFKMMPSRNLFKPGTGNLMVGPSQESQLGFYLMTKTSAGRAKLNKLLPKKFHIKGVMNKGASKALFMKLAKELPNAEFSQVIDDIKKLGENKALESGFTLALKDINVLPGRDTYIKKIEAAAKKSLLSGDTTSFNAKLDEIDANIDKHLRGKNNSLHEMVISGARGNKSQLRQIVASPFIVNDPSGKMITTPIGKSFAEGLDLSDYWIASYGARKGMMDRARGTSEPGVFNKAMIAATMNNVVSEEDCGTTKGIPMSVNSKEVLGRFLQGKQGGVNDEAIIDENIVKYLKKKKIKTIIVRSPLTCEANKGTCRHCYGVDENGGVVNIGDNLGAKTAQTISEPLTQMTMNTFHTGGVAGTGTKGGYARIKELVDMPKNLKVGKATLATVNGTVDKIEDSGLGGYNVYINGKKHITGRGLSLKVRKGTVLKKGDALSTGSISPQEMLQYKGMKAVQNYMTDELQEAYASEGMDIDRKTFETVVKSITNKTKVLNNVKGLDALPGDFIPLHVAENYNKTARDGEKLRHIPEVTGIKYIPQQSGDWLAQLGATNLVNAIKNGASQGWSSDVKGYHPIPALAFGATFGEGENGAY